MAAVLCVCCAFAEQTVTLPESSYRLTLPDEMTYDGPGNAAEGALKVNPEKSGNYMVLSALPATQGIYGFVAFLVWLSRDFAKDGAMLFGVGISVGIVCLLSAIRQGKVCANGIVGVSQGHDVFTNTLIYAALPEFYAILGLVGALMLG